MFFVDQICLVYSRESFLSFKAPPFPILFRSQHYLGSYTTVAFLLHVEVDSGDVKHLSLGLKRLFFLLLGKQFSL